MSPLLHHVRRWLSGALLALAATAQAQPAATITVTVTD